MAIEIVDLPIKNGGSFHSYVNVYQRVSISIVHMAPTSSEGTAFVVQRLLFVFPAHHPALRALTSKPLKRGSAGQAHVGPLTWGPGVLGKKER